MNEEQLKSFIEKRKSNGQIGGIYWTPFTDWARDPERTVDAAPEYKYKDIYLYAKRKACRNWTALMQSIQRIRQWKL